MPTAPSYSLVADFPLSSRVRLLLPGQHHGRLIGIRRGRQVGRSGTGLRIVGQRLEIDVSRPGTGLVHIADRLHVHLIVGVGREILHRIGGSGHHGRLPGRGRDRLICHIPAGLRAARCPGGDCRVLRNARSGHGQIGGRVTHRRHNSVQGDLKVVDIPGGEVGGTIHTDIAEGDTSGAGQAQSGEIGE